MNKSESQSAKLSRTIRELEQQAETEKVNFRSRSGELMNALKPGNLLNLAFEKLKESPKLRTRAMTGIAVVALAVAAKMIISKRLHHPPTQKEKENISQASRVVTPITKLLKPILTIIASRLLDNKKASTRKSNIKTETL